MDSKVVKYVAAATLGAFGGFVLSSLVRRQGDCCVLPSSRTKSKNTDKKSHIYAGIEAGGTTFVVAIAEGSTTNIVDRMVVRTTNPAETLKAVADWLRGRTFDSLGIASFGPVDLNHNNPTYGYITTTPKPFWGNCDVLGYFKKEFPSTPIGFDTDVNAAALGQFCHHDDSSSSRSSSVYVTVGTGIGIGLVVNSKPVHGASHPEGGHICVPKADEDSSFRGLCPFHTDCLEGLCNSHAIAKRVGCTIDDLKNLSDDHPIWFTVAHYLGHLCATLTLTIAPEVIMLGGGVMQRECLFPLIRKKTQEILAGYIQIPLISSDSYIVPPKFGPNAGAVGAIVLGKLASEADL
eukprot:GILK01001621.1.p1 GENE.GILK01001621.1~~GILK01001621.1.p1  ORF type:complete len:361 (-),score=33.47 GILK01001621.1:137-1183(-)